MTEEKRIFQDVRVNELSYPVKVGAKFNYEDKFTIADIDIKSKIEKKYAENFKKEIYKIIGSSETYSGVNELTSLLLKYINSMNALTANISFSYPYFISKKSPVTGEISIVRCNCRYILRKESLIRYQKKFIIEMPVLIPHYVIPGYINEVAEVSAKVIVEIEGFDTLFVEDISEIVEKNVTNIVFNYGSSLIKEIKEDLRTKHFIDECSVKIVNQEIKTGTKRKPVKNENYYDYESEHLFI